MMRQRTMSIGPDCYESSGAERSLFEGRAPRVDTKQYSAIHKRPSTLGRQKLAIAPQAESPRPLAAQVVQPAATQQLEASERPSMEYQFPRLPADTYQRQVRFLNGERVDPMVSFLHGHEARPILFAWRPFNDPFSRDVNAPAPVLDRDADLLNRDFLSGRGGPFYGRYLGPASLTGSENGPPLTPVDKAAYIHDKNYFDIYNRYQYSEFEHGLALSRFLGTGDGSAMVLGWSGSHISLDPAMQLELAWADAKLIGGSWANMGEGLMKGFYSGRRGQNALIADLAWASAVTVTYGAIATWRLGMVTVGIVYQFGRGVGNLFQGLGDRIGGDVGRVVSGIGNVVHGALDIAAGAFAILGTAAFAAYVLTAGIVGAVVGGLVYVGGKVVQGVADAISDAVEWVGDRVGCFITEAVTTTTADPDDGLRLRTLRAFRDEYVVSLPGGRRMVLTYVERAPLIVDAINARTDRLSVWEEVRARWIDPAVQAVREDRKADAMRLYAEMFEALAVHCKVDLAYDGARSHWKRDPRMKIT